MTQKHFWKLKKNNKRLHNYCNQFTAHNKRDELHFDKLYSTMEARISQVTEKMEEIISFHTAVIFISKVLLMFYLKSEQNYLCGICSINF
jgi:hypothetical protein